MVCLLIEIVGEKSFCDSVGSGVINVVVINVFVSKCMCVFYLICIDLMCVSFGC